MASGFPLEGVLPVHFISAPLFHVFTMALHGVGSEACGKMDRSARKGMEWKPRVVGRMRRLVLHRPLCLRCMRYEG
jgi:hypothetical protein